MENITPYYKGVFSIGNSFIDNFIDKFTSLLIDKFAIRLCEKIFLFIDFHSSYTATPLKPPKGGAKDNVDYSKKKEFRKQAMILKQIILERELTDKEKELIIGEQVITKDYAKNTISELLKKVDKKKKQNNK